MKYLSIALLSWTSLCCHPIDHALISIYAANMRSGEVLMDRSSELSLIPASCIKLITTAAALTLLGPDYRFETTLEHDGTFDPTTGIVKGNLWIRGGGDPSLGSCRFGSSWRAQIQEWITALKSLRINTIAGQVLADISKWESPRAIPSWEWEDLGNYYAAPASALTFSDNSYSLTLNTSMDSSAVITSIDPPQDPELFLNELTLGPKESGEKAHIFAAETGAVKIIRGTLAKGASALILKGAIHNSAELCTQLLSQELKRQEMLSECRSQRSTRIPLHTTLSPPLKDIIYQTNQHSVNLYAEHLLKKMGEVCNYNGSTSAGLEACATFLKAQGIDLEGFEMVDGSGLSRHNLMTTKQLVTLLIAMKRSPHYEIFLDSLPLQPSGERAKSGTMSLIKTLAGYQGDIAFAIFINNCPDRTVAQAEITKVLSALRSENKARHH